MPITGLHSYQTRLNHLVAEANMRMGSPAAFPGKSLQPLMPQKKNKKAGSKSKKQQTKNGKSAKKSALQEKASVDPIIDSVNETGEEEKVRTKDMVQAYSTGESTQAGAFYRNVDTQQLARGILWAEILGEPVSVKRRRRRMKQYVSQSYVDRR